MTSLLDLLLRRRRHRPENGGPLLPRLRDRSPEEVPETERRLAERFAAELHAFSPREVEISGRRMAALAEAVRRRRPDELREALEGFELWELRGLVAQLSERRDFDKAGALQTARLLVERASTLQSLATALSLLALGPDDSDRERILDAASSPALAPVGALILESLPQGRIEALLSLAGRTFGIARALVLERLCLVAAESEEMPALPAAPTAEALRLLEAVEDDAARAYGAVPLLEVGDVEGALGAGRELASAVAAALEAASLGGWRGGPGPGLGRLPGGIYAAEVLLQDENFAKSARRRAAKAVLDAHPQPPGISRRLAEELCGD